MKKRKLGEYVIECSFGHKDAVVIESQMAMRFGEREASITQRAYKCKQCGESWIEGDVEKFNAEAIRASSKEVGV